MARDESRVCIIKGCGKYKVIGDYCTRHSKEILTSTSPQGQVETVVADTPAEVHVINLIDMFRVRQEQEMAEFIQGLTMCADSQSRLKYAYERVCGA